MKRYSQAFSWIDMVVLMALVCIAIAIFFPLFTPHHGGSRQVMCPSNLKEFGIGLQQYAQDNDEMFPVGPGTHRGGGWAGAVYPYIKSMAVYACSEDGIRADRSAHPPRIPVSYAFNQFLAESNKETIGGATYAGNGGVLAKVKDPKKTILLFEITGSRVDVLSDDEGGRGRDRTSFAGDGLTLLSYDGNNAEQSGSSASVGGAVPGGAKYATGQITGWNQTPQPGQWTADPRHEGGANYAFVDGHVRYLNPASVGVVQRTGIRAYWAQK